MGRDSTLSRREDASPAVASDVRQIATVYVQLAGGDAEAALLQAIADGLAASRLVSRGYARWGPPPGPRKRR